MNPMEELNEPRRDAQPTAMSRPTTYQPKRSPWPGLLGAAVLVAAVAAVVAWNAGTDNTPKAPVDIGATTPTPTPASPADASKGAAQDPAVADSTRVTPAAPAKQ